MKGYIVEMPLSGNNLYETAIIMMSKPTPSKMCAL